MPMLMPDAEVARAYGVHPVTLARLLLWSFQLFSLPSSPSSVPQAQQEVILAP